MQTKRLRNAPAGAATKSRRRLVASAAGLALAAPVALVLMTQPASAVTPYERCGQPYQRVYTSSGGSVRWHSVPVSVPVRGKGSMHVEQSKTMSTTVTGSIGVNDVSKVLGFAVEKSWQSTTSSGASYDVPAGRYGRVVLTMLRYQGSGSYMECQSYGIDGWRWYGPVSYSYTTYRKSTQYFEPQYASSSSGPWA